MAPMTQNEQWGFDGSRLRTRRKQRHLTQRQLAIALGVSQATICEYETGKSSPSLETLSNIAVILNTSTDYLLGLTNDPRPATFSSAMTETEQDLLKVFYSLPPEKRERAVGILIGLGEG